MARIPFVEDLLTRYGYYCNRNNTSLGYPSSNPIHRMQKFGVCVKRIKSIREMWIKNPKQKRVFCDPAYDDPLEFEVLEKILKKLDMDLYKTIYEKYCVLREGGRWFKDRDRWKKLDISERTFYDRIERAHAIIDNAYEALRVNDRGLEINA